MRCLWKYVIILALWAVPAAANMTVAVITPKAGVWSKQGAELTAGAKKAAEEINANGGLLKQKIKILDIDDQCSKSQLYHIAAGNHKISSGKLTGTGKIGQ